MATLINGILNTGLVEIIIWFEQLNKVKEAKENCFLAKRSLL